MRDQEFIEAEPGMKSRFLFWTGEAREEKESFLRANALEYLYKPLDLREIAQMIRERVLGTFKDM
jgi:hypothetical protein